MNKRISPNLHSIARVFIFIFVAAFILSETGFAQCDGVFFKTQKGTKLSERFLYHFSADFDGDGDKDIIGLRMNTNQFSPNAILFFERTSAGFQSAPVVTPMTFNAVAHWFVVGDVNGDDKPDLIVEYNTSAPVAISYLSNGNGTFSTSTPSLIDGGAAGFERLENAVDVNGDGLDDLLTITFASSNLGYRLANANGTFQNRIALQDHVSRVFATDFTGDQQIDLSVFYDDPVTSNPDYLLLLRNLGSGIFAPDTTNQVLTRIAPLVVGDFNGDDRPDLATAEYPDPINLSPKFSLYMNSKGGVFSKVDFPAPNTGFQYGAPYAGDFDGDGSDDIGYFNGGGHRVYLNSGDGTSFSPTDSSASYGGGYPEDTDGDGRMDFVRLRSSTLNLVTHIEPGNGFQYYAYNVIAFEKNVCAKPGETRIVDYNGDGRTDPGFWRPSDGRWRWLERVSGGSSGVTLTEQTANWGLGSLGDIQAPNDFDGDGKTDLGIYRASTGTWWIKRSSDGVGTAFRFGLEGDHPVAADYDGDGKADYALYRPSEGNWYVWLSETDSFFAAHFGLEGDIPLPGDYDGDSKADLAVFRPSTGVWYYYHSSDANFTAIQFGISTDIPVPGDYDNDGRMDYAVYRPSDGIWYIMSSADLAVDYIFFGAFGDVPAPTGFQADYTEATVFRRSQSRYYFQNMGSSYYVGVYDWGFTFDERVVVSTIQNEGF
ncbi:MAG: VCBS repeat-containing protein [Pyrinomonadaceae bacterium]